MFESIFNLHAWSNLSQFLYWMRNFAQTIKHAVIVYMLFQEKNAGVPGSNLKDFSHMRPRRYYNQNNCILPKNQSLITDMKALQYFKSHLVVKVFLI
jgi:hypothetical protein